VRNFVCDQLARKTKPIVPIARSGAGIDKNKTTERYSANSENVCDKPRAATRKNFNIRERNIQSADFAEKSFKSLAAFN
jgi:hypothetical protein